MQLHETPGGAASRLSGYGTGYFVVNEQRFETSVILTSSGGCAAWSARSMADLSFDALQRALASAPDIVLLGTGARHQFAPADLVAHAAAQHAALEAMNSGAACRTYNVLAAEGRAVAALLLVIDSTDC